MTTTIYSLEQGIRNPRDGAINWQTYDNYETLTQAKRESKDHKGFWRIVKAEVVWTKEPEAP